MIPTHYKYLAAILAFAGFTLGIFTLGRNYEAGQVSIEEVEEHVEEVETHNEKTFTLEEVNSKLLAQERALRGELTRGPRHDVSDVCPVDQLTVMRQSKIDRFNSTLFPE